VYLLKSYHNNLTKRAIKIPKLYFLDTGTLFIRRIAPKLARAAALFYLSAFWRYSGHLYCTSYKFKTILEYFSCFFFENML